MAMDCVGGDFTGQMLRALRPGGTCYLFGALQSTDIQVLLQNSASIGISTPGTLSALPCGCRARKP